MTEQPIPALKVTRKSEAARVRDLMSPPIAVFEPDATVSEAVKALRELTREAIVTYCYVVDPEGKLLGVVVMRDMLLAPRTATLESLMIRAPFSLGEDMKLEDALKTALVRHYPVYPVCDGEGRLTGLVRGEDLFAEQAIEISAQSGQMVGVDKEERFATPFARSLPVMAGQTGNTGLQALAVALRGITLGELKPQFVGRLMIKETALGFLNGLLVGLTAAAGMFIYASTKGEAEPIMLAFTVLVAMVGSCTIAGFAGSVIPLMLKRFGADPATASGIFLTTASDIASMGMFLTFATLLLL